MVCVTGGGCVSKDEREHGACVLREEGVCDKGVVREEECV